MATHDYVIANQSGAAFRTDLNNETEYRRFNKSNEWLLYKGGLMLVYRIPNFAINN